ncbi:adventurous gliding motility protein GltJ [Corallococcus sp. BB11-1]|uniref:adventurous gliding motility protein GltJ n=1 Tax=Corallococcus sp. BB11-1 TaxID=2996783 RepID=UPI00226EB093|nr:adventurous gliding motility protein GltJ [Corallococcus sp. BB11-1]MCY1031441.1 adventurous gliding motility protein GltJ [Corallococcus sp. BB11-1]
MRFVCDSCRAQYMISDDKIGPKGVKLRCKKCGHTILVRPAGASAGKEGGADTPAATEAKAGAADSNAPRIVESSGTGLPATLGTPPEGGLFTDVEEDEIGAVFDQVLSTGSQKAQARDAEAEAVKAAKAETVRKLAEAEAAEPSPDDAKAAASHEWYVAIDEKQVGPWSVEKVKDAWDRGEVGPDNLCWRSSFSDWIPLSETAELASVLAPRPAKPVIVAPAPVSTSSPTIAAGPVESAFSAGSTRPGLGGGSTAPDEPVGWKPSAASVLASLVKEENDALTKPPPRPAPSLDREPLSQSRLLDVPMPPPEPKSSPAMMGAAPGMAAPAAYAPQPQGYAPQPQGYAPQQPVPQYAQQPQGYPQQQAQMPYGQQPQGYPPPGYPAAYPPPAAAPTGSKGRTGMLVAVTAGVLVIAVAAVVALTRGSSTERPPEAPAQVATRPAELPPMPPPPVVAQPPPAAVAATAPAAAPVEGTPAAGTPAAGAPAAGAAPATAPAVAAAPAAATPPPAVVTPPPATPPNTATVVAKVEPRNQRRPGSGNSGSRQREDDGEAITVSKPSAAPAAASGDDDFDELFGTKKTPASTKPAGKTTTTAYIPPEPGGGTLDRLQQSDIMQVVLNNKPAIVKCVNEQKQKDPSLSGKLVMRWTVQPSGKTSSVSCRTDEFRTSHMATCITGLIKGWSFPKHQKQGDPIDFPFTF